MEAKQNAEYKGHTYRLLWMGQTKFGRRAHLQFFDGSKDFWADASLVSVSDGRSANRDAGLPINHYFTAKDGSRRCWVEY